jgi:RNA polymerase sigma-70 factor (ECF subfamily)
MDTPQFTSAIRQHEAPLTSYAYSLTKDYHNAHDLIQETYFRAISNKEKYAEGTNLKAWLLTIMRNIFIND